MSQTVLILGASGRFGRNAADQFARAGWTVRRFDRKRDRLNVAAKGADVIVNGWNPAYPDWQRQVPVLTAQVIEAAKLSGATVIVPGNVYVFGARTPAPWSETVPHRAENPLGQVRRTMEAAYRNSGVPTVILRAGDFLDTEASGNWFDMILTKWLAKGRFDYPGDPGIPHAWAFLPDLCRAAVHLAELRAELPRFADVPFAGYTLSGEDLRAGLERVTGKPVRLKRMSWLPLQLARPVWPMARSLIEMRYLWQTPHWLDGSLFHRLCPDFTVTPLDRALAAAIPGGLVQRQVDPDQTVPAGA
ncbi:epimerase [Seohaeicola saemankumensis]|nr:epimerase [Seohaeicola saemankumensis]MCA0873095.1 epimerase [Seohaeicola saemankumensis]